MSKQKDPSDKKPSSGSVHAGHRHRVRQRFLRYGFDALYDHEILEFLLFYAIPRRDVNEMAHRLISRFGSIAGVLDAPEDELREIPGVGEQIAHFLNMTPGLMSHLTQQFERTKLSRLAQTEDLPILLAERCRNFAPPETLVIHLNAQMEAITIYRYPSFDPVTVREVVRPATYSCATYIVLVECVPDCTQCPSPKRLVLVDKVADVLESIRVPLWDYFTVDLLGHPPHSHAESGQILRI